MATITIKDMEVVGTTIGVSTPLMKAFEAAGQTYARFDVLINSGGYVAVGADDAASVSASAAVMGLALSAATGTTGAEVIFHPFIPGITLIEANLCADDAGTAHTLLQTNFGVAYGIGLVSGSWVLAVDNTTVTQVVAIPLRPAVGSAVGDSNARVVAVICSSHFVRAGALA